MPPNRNILEALFDVRPINESGSLDLEKIERIKPVIDLKPRPKEPEAAQSMVTLGNELTEPVIKPVASNFIPEVCPPDILSKKYLLEEIEKNLSQPSDITAELASIGGQVHTFFNRKTKPKSYHPPNPFRRTYEAEKAKKELSSDTARFNSELRSEPEKNIESFWHKSEKNHYSSPSEREMEMWVAHLKKENEQKKSHKKPSTEGPVKKKHKYASFSIFVVLFLILFGYLGGMKIKEEVVSSGYRAVNNLQNAGTSLTDFDFLKAAGDFSLAYDNFSQASDTMSAFGASILSNFSNLPGLNSVRSAGNLVKAGQSISKAGENISLAFNSLSGTNLLSKQPLSKSISDFKDALVTASSDIYIARSLLADIDDSAVPPEKKEIFLDFRDKIPEFQKYVGGAIDYSNFLLEIVGSSSPKKYLVLFQNNSELRATGGFPGSYAIISFENGSLKNVVVDDVYNIDGQLKENIIPPKPLQHITRNWGMRDANWFVDFPASARKVEEFYIKDGGSEVNGVFSITPTVISRILEIIGPIAMPEYGLTVNAGNFLEEIQEEVEYGANRSQPKTIVKDFQPKFFAKLAEADKSKWLEIFKVLTQAADEKQILSYFNNSNLQKFAIANDLAGEVKKTDGDYLQVIFSNVKGSKTDAVVKNSFNLETDISSPGVVNHKLSITRQHTGGSSKFGFYNKVSPAYIRVLVPTGTILKSVNGQSLVDFRPLIGHEDYNFRTDDDLAAIENGITHPFSGVDVFRESGKTVFGFWLVLKPKEQKTVTIEYHTPIDISVQDSYDLLWQKQSGTIQDPMVLDFSFPENAIIKSTSDGLKILGRNVSGDLDLATDRKIEVNYK